MLSRRAPAVLTVGAFYLVAFEVAPKQLTDARAADVRAGECARNSVEYPCLRCLTLQLKRKFNFFSKRSCFLRRHPYNSPSAAEYDGRRNPLPSGLLQAIRGVVVQLVRIPACHAGGRGFESRPLRQLLDVEKSALSLRVGKVR